MITGKCKMIRPDSQIKQCKPDCETNDAVPWFRLPLQYRDFGHDLTSVWPPLSSSSTRKP